VGKPSQSRPSRKERKVSRERRDRALQHGLPAVDLPAPRQRSVESDHRVETASVISTPPVARVSGNDIPKPWRRFTFSAVPMQLRVLLGAVLVLIVIGLYRRSTEDSGGGGESVVAPPDTVAAAAVPPEPQPAAELPKAPPPARGEAVSHSVPAPEAATAPQIPVAVPSERTPGTVTAGSRPRPAKAAAAAAVAVTAAPPVVAATPTPAAVPADQEPKKPAVEPSAPSQKASGAGNATPSSAENPY
jgi:hypothetical protein